MSGPIYILTILYRKLDVDHTIDRQGRVTSNTYDAIRELLSTTDPLGRTTKYSWCTCGGLSTLTDANGNVTTWGLDEQGRVTSKTYADSSAINYVYESNLSRLHTMTDARGSVATYSYNADNTLAGTVYSPGTGVATTPNVSFTYDSVYNRVLTMADGTGTTSYAYNPITGTATLGAGRLASVTVPVYSTSATASVTYAYDELGRVVTRGVDHATTNANNVSTTFDALGRVTGVSNALGAFTYAYVDQTSRLK
jgi:YD repeat-containing protein